MSAPNVFNYFPTVRCLDCLPFVAVTNDAVMNTHEDKRGVYL